MMQFCDNYKDDSNIPVITSSSQYLLTRELRLTWKNISFKVEKKKKGNYTRDFFTGRETEYIQLLNEVHGIVKSGTLMAIMGPSGAGKTSLLATISLRIKGFNDLGNLSGDVFLNGNPVNAEIMSRISGFVPQQELEIDSLTVAEHMEFMARMKMDRGNETSLRSHQISILLKQLGLIECRFTKLSELSCGERKRLSLAVELLPEPKILFCDEPTTGLDSYAAMTVIKTLKNLAYRGCIVICSLHQPASGLLDLFDEIVLLSSGRLAFQGNTVEALQFFNDINIQCPDTFNIAEFFVKQLSIDREKEFESKNKVKWICDEFQNSIYGTRILQIINESYLKTSVVSISHPICSLTKIEFKKVKPVTQLYWLTWRLYIQHKRNFSLIFLRFFLYMFISILLSTPYIGIAKTVDQKGIQNIQGLLYLIITETIFTFNYSVLHTFSKELPMLLRDISSGLYNPAPYYLSKILISIPGTIIQPLIFATCIYKVVGFNGKYLNFVYFVIPIILSAFSASAMGYLMSSVFSINMASLWSVPIDFLTLIFSGLFLQLRNLPFYVEWIKYISHFYYGVEALSLIQWQEIDNIDCSSDPVEPCISTGHMVLEKYGYNINHYNIDCFGLLIIFSISHIIGFLAIKNRSHNEAIY